MDPELKNFEASLRTTANKLHEEFITLRTNRPTTKLVEDIKVDYFGQEMPLKALGTIGIQPPRQITITVWDKNALAPAAKAIEVSGIGMTPNMEGNTIRLNLPALTDERREELKKLVKKTAEETRIKIRLAREDMMKKVKAAEDRGEMGESEMFKLKEQVQKMVEDANGKIEDMLQAKVKEIEE